MLQSIESFEKCQKRKGIVKPNGYVFFLPNEKGIEVPA